MKELRKVNSSKMIKAVQVLTEGTGRPRLEAQHMNLLLHLYSLGQTGDLKATLAEKLGITPSAVGTTVKNFSAFKGGPGLIEVFHDFERPRGDPTRLTPKGKKLVEKYFDAVAKAVG